MKKLFIVLFAALFGINTYAQTPTTLAQRAMDAEQYERARNILEDLLKAHPNDGQSYFLLGNLYLIMGEDSLARVMYNKGAASSENAQFNYIGQGQMLLNEGKAPEAQALFDKATAKLRKKDYQEYLFIARAYLGAYDPDYTKAAEYARKAVAVDPTAVTSATSYLALGDAEYNLGNLNEAYSAYRNAYMYDANLWRAKLHLAVITKNAQAFPEAIQALVEINELSPNYGPAYRELAEVYYLWATLDKEKYDEYITKALQYYEKYMSMTDYSLNSRMRHADFLVLAKDYAALEKEAAEMQKLDKVNLRILRYLGYSAYENGNYAEATKALTDFINSVDPRRVLGIDYLYLAKAEAKMLEGESVDKIDTSKLNKMNSFLAQALDKGAEPDSEFKDLGIKFYRAKDYDNAADIFGTLAHGPKPGLIERLYYSNSIFYNAATMDSVAQAAYLPKMMKADSVYATVIEGSPTTQDTYFNRARLNRYMPNSEEKVASIFEQFINVVTEKGEKETSKPLTRIKLSEAYSNIGAYYADKDTAKAIAAFEKAVEYDANNEHAVSSLKFLKGAK